MPTVYLHIGMNKAGSSAIQSYFHTNRTRLQTQGLLWPDTGLGRQDNGDGCHFELSEWLGFGPNAKTAADDDAILEMRDRLDAEIAASGAETVFMSSEFFVLNRDMSRVRQFFEGLDTYIVVYLRRHDHWWASLYAQAIRTTPRPPWNRSFKGFYEFQMNQKRQHLEFGPFVELWAEVFGQNRVIVCPYEEEQNQPDLISHLLDVIGRPDVSNGIPPSDQRVNATLSLRSLSLIDLVQRAQIDQHTKDMIIAEIIRDYEEEKSDGSLVPPYMRRQLVDENLADYEWIAENFLNRPDGQLFYEPIPPKGDAPAKETMLPAPRPVEFFARHFRQ